MDSISEEKSIVRKILAKLPTRDVARCRCVCRRWRRIAADPTFRALHGSSGGGGDDVQAQTLLVYEIRSSATVDMLVLDSPSSRRLMCRVTDLFTAARYSPANACNGFLLLAPRIHDWPLCVCNPVTGEKLILSEAPAVQHDQVSSYALGFSPSTARYKLFRLSFLPNGGGCYMDVRTLGDGGDKLWRRHPGGALQHRAVSPPSPALVDGKIYLTCGEGILAMDVATEAHRTYPLPMSEGENNAVAFELRGRLCVAVHVVAQRKLYFWVLHLDQDDKDGTTCLPDWKLGYTFRMGHGGDNNGGEDHQPRGAGFNDRDGTLCYRMSDRLYTYSTTKNDDHHHEVGALLRWDNITRLPNKELWNVYGGYRPTLVSPRSTLRVVDPLAEQRRKEFEDSLLAALRARSTSSFKNRGSRSISSLYP